MDGTTLDVGLMFSFRNPAAWRRPFPDVYRDELALIEHAEVLGYDTIWLTEHHFADDGYSPSIIPLAAAIAARTERVRIGFNLLLLPLHNAIRVAEDIAMLDHMSGGRAFAGFARGWMCGGTTQPKGIHMMPTPVHEPVAAEYVAAIAECIALVRNGDVTKAKEVAYN